ncbi:hypothetical protein C2U70_18510 [Bradyrhizobium guangdongense]|uniref:M15 family metallopeptidase n=1 Tax=Bradyrhizobium guangdongense TaxID=1325090 RepID=UPI00112C3F04|nr:M15 family metallopeptidase [Bradyrhizobium guangdongense]TPQ33826.1 hypothetical protein C2U70_18510 [Bradyrhizobium guangdongense]
MTRISLLTAMLASLSFPAIADPALDALLAAYADRLASYSEDELIWKDGSRMPLGRLQPNLPFEQRLNQASIRDQFAIPYPLSGAPFQAPAPDVDPGRLRNEAFFLKMYGDCRKGEVKPRLKAVPWLPNHGGGSVRVTTINGVADQLEKVSRELDQLPTALIGFLVPMSGTYNCRPIAETNRLSVHAFGAAIDINARFGDYWLWAKRPDGSITWRNRIPREIVELFERHGFIWGGRWHHFDSLHFEYRPELIALAKQGWPRE